MKLIMALVVCFSVNAFANHHEGWKKKWDSMSYEDAKRMYTEKLDKKQAMLDEQKACVNAAKDKAGLNLCKDKAMAMRKEWKDKMKKKK